MAAHPPAGSGTSLPVMTPHVDERSADTPTAASEAPSVGSRPQLPLTPTKPRLRGLLHLIAFPTTLIAGLLLVAFGEDLATRIACVIFVVTAGMLFGISATYHRGTWKPEHAIILRRFDHANIFLIIAGTYTPLAISLLEPAEALVVLSIAWGGAIIGVLFRIFWTSAPRWLYVPAYIALGWVAVFYMPEFIAGGGWSTFGLILGGGIAYTIGAVIYGLKRPDPSPKWFGFHEIFHAATIAGFVCHFIAIALAIR